MKEFFIKFKIPILRISGFIMLIVAFSIYFWSTPKDGLTQNKIATANVARMEARVSGGSGTNKIATSSADIMKAYKETQAAQKKYALILVMILGIGFLGYSFINKKD